MVRYLPIIYFREFLHEILENVSLEKEEMLMEAVPLLVQAIIYVTDLLTKDLRVLKQIDKASFSAMKG